MLRSIAATMDKTVHWLWFLCVIFIITGKIEDNENLSAINLQTKCLGSVCQLPAGKCLHAKHVCDREVSSKLTLLKVSSNFSYQLGCRGIFLVPKPYIFCVKIQLITRFNHFIILIARLLFLLSTSCCFFSRKIVCKTEKQM